MIDFDETNRLKKLLLDNPENYKAIIEDTAIAICITDENGIFADMNENYCLLYGYTKEEMLGKSFLMVVQQNQQSQLQDLHDDFIKLKDEIIKNWEVLRANGDKMHIFADAEFSNEIMNQKHKVTFVWPKEEELQTLLLNNKKKKV